MIKGYSSREVSLHTPLALCQGYKGVAMGLNANEFGN